MKKFSFSGAEVRRALASVFMFIFAFPLSAQVADTVFVTDSSKYEGQYPDGRGVLYSDDEGLIIGEFRNGVPEGVSTHYMPDGSRYYGNFRNGKHCGYGHFFSKSGKVLAGEFKDGYANGLDTLWYPDGSVYVGKCVNGRPLSKMSAEHGHFYRKMHVLADLAGAKPVFNELELTAEQQDFIGRVSKEYAKLTRNDKGPRFKGQEPDAFGKWVISKLKYPSDARENHIEGVVRVKFVIDSDGSLDDVTVLESPDESLTKEMLRVIGMSPKWSPAVHKGKKIRVPYTYSVTFKL